MKNSQKLKLAITKCSIILLLVSYATPAFAATFDEQTLLSNQVDSEELNDEETNLESTEESSLEDTSDSDTKSEDIDIEESSDSETIPSSEVEETDDLDTESTLEDSSEEVSDTTEDSEEISSDSSEIPVEDSTETTPTEPSDTIETEDVPTATTPEEQVMPGPAVTHSLGGELAATSFVASNLNGFELPLLQTYSDQREAALTMLALGYLNSPYEKGAQGPERFDNLNFPRYVYQQAFGLAIGTEFSNLTTIGKQTVLEEVTPGDLLVWEKEEKVALYLGQDKFIMADDTLTKEDHTQGTTEEIPGVRIFTLHREVNETDADNQDLLTRYDFMRTPDYGVAKSPEWTLSAAGNQVISDYPASFNFQENEQTNAFIDLIGESARDLGQEYDLFASVLIAQAILESGGGSSGLASPPYHNLFGIKGEIGPSSVVLPTQEDNGKGELYSIRSAFRVYPDYESSLVDYVHLIRTGISGNPDFYQGVWRSSAKNYLTATAELTGKYATDTFYYNKLNSLIATYQLTRFDEPRVDLAGGMMRFEEIPTEYREKIRFPEYNGQNYNLSGSYGSDQCTWYVYNRVTQLGGKVGDFMGNGADWKETGIREGYQTSDVPKVGYVISFKQGVAGYHPLYGHVAFVEAVGEEGILISEGDASYLSYRVIPNEIALSSGVGYLAPK